MPFEKLTLTITEKLNGFRPLDEGGGDRHGVWECVWVKARGQKGHLYVSLTATEIFPTFLAMQIWAGADDGIHFGRSLVKSLPPMRESDVEFITQPGLADEVIKGLQQAVHRAAAIPDSDLTQPYIVHFAGESAH